LFVIRDFRFPDYLENSIGAGAGAGSGCDPQEALRAMPAAAARMIAIFIIIVCFCLFFVRYLGFPDYLEISIGVHTGAGSGCDPQEALRAMPAAAARMIAIFIMLLLVIG